MRVYYDKSADETTKCETECQRSESSKELIDNGDHCFVNEMYLNFSSFVNKKPIDLDYPHAMMWRWYPIGILK